MYIYSLFNDSSSVQTIHLYSYPVYLNIYGNLYYKSKITIVQSFSFFECSRTFDFSIILFINVLSTLPRASTTLSSVYFFRCLCDEQLFTSVFVSDFVKYDSLLPLFDCYSLSVSFIFIDYY